MLTELLRGELLKILHVIALADSRSGAPTERIARQEEAMPGQASSVLIALDAPKAPFPRGTSMSIHTLGRAKHPNGAFCTFDFGISSAIPKCLVSRPQLMRRSFIRGAGL